MRGKYPASSCLCGIAATVLRCRFDATSLSTSQAALQDAHVSRRWLAALTDELELVVERCSSAMDEAEAIAIAISFKHSHTSQRA